METCIEKLTLRNDDHFRGSFWTGTCSISKVSVSGTDIEVGAFSESLAPDLSKSWSDICISVIVGICLVNLEDCLWDRHWYWCVYRVSSTSAVPGSGRILGCTVGPCKYTIPLSRLTLSSRSYLFFEVITSMTSFVVGNHHRKGPLLNCIYDCNPFYFQTLLSFQLISLCCLCKFHSQVCSDNSQTSLFFHWQGTFRHKRSLAYQNLNVLTKLVNWTIPHFQMRDTSEIKSVGKECL